MDYDIINIDHARRRREDDDDDDICRSFYIKEPVDFSPRLTDPRPATIRASKRFFTSPIIASSLVEEARLSGAAAAAASSFSSWPSQSSASAGKTSCSETSTPMTVFSEKPYDDFRRSMAEMVKAHHAEEVVELDWEFMEQMLFSYLELNDRSVHQDILEAFADLAATAAGGGGA